MSNSSPTILVIAGISGNLARRKLLPAIIKMKAAGVLPEKFRIVGLTRKSDLQLESLFSFTSDKSYLLANTELFKMNLEDGGDYAKLSERLDNIGKEFGEHAQRIFYLSVPPQALGEIVENLGTSGLAKVEDTKLLVEKPFGIDFVSAKELIEHIDKHFSPDQVYRIDHYLAKETAQNIIVFRENNSLFKRTWNNQFIERIEITASESIDIEGRSTFYEQTGALRDIVQSHLLQLAALVLMDTPRQGNFQEVPKRRLDALSQIVVDEDNGKPKVKRAQYENYREEVKNPYTCVETFVSLDIISTDPKWEGVEINLATGKGLSAKRTDIKIIYKKEQGYEANHLLLKLQPDEGAEVSVWAKQPGYEHKLNCHVLKFSFKEHYDVLPEAYEQILFNVFNSDHTLFASSGEILESWRILDPVLKAWEKRKDDLFLYKEGTDIDELR